MSTKSKPVTSVAEAAVAIAKLPQNAQYKSGAALVEAAAPGTARRVATQVRQQMRDAGKGVGRGHRYDTITPKLWAQAYKEAQADSQRRKDTAKAARAKTAKSETAKGETAKSGGSAKKPAKAKAERKPAALVGDAPTSA